MLKRKEVGALMLGAVAVALTVPPSAEGFFGCQGTGGICRTGGGTNGPGSWCQSGGSGSGSNTSLSTVGSCQWYTT
jgi:hypothetical protein